MSLPGPCSLLELLDWRREVTPLYAAVRAERSPAVAHAGWGAVRDRLLAGPTSGPARTAVWWST